MDGLRYTKASDWQFSCIFFWARGIIKMPFWLQKGESAPWGVVVSWLASLACHPEEQLQKGKERDEVRSFGALRCLLSGLSNAV